MCLLYLYAYVCFLVCVFVCLSVTVIENI